MEKTISNRFTQFFYGDDIETMVIFFDKKIFNFHTESNLYILRGRLIFFSLVLCLLDCVWSVLVGIYESVRRVKNVYDTLGDLPMKQW